MHDVFVSIGSNLGDRRAHVLGALQRLRAATDVVAVSSMYESPPQDGATGGAFFNLVARLRAGESPTRLAALLREIELAVGGGRREPLMPRAIDLAILMYGDLVADAAGAAVPQRDLAGRPYDLVPLAELAPDLREPISGETLGALAARLPAAGLVVRARALDFRANRQEDVPDVALSIDRVGVAGVKAELALQIGDRTVRCLGEFAMVADLAPDRAGVHMSRFSELLAAATLQAAARAPSGAIDVLVASVARAIVDSQRALRADVRVRAEFTLDRYTPVSGRLAPETYALVAIAHAGDGEARVVAGVEAEGMTACPCAQGMVREQSQRDLEAAGFSPADAARALAVLPVATHNQRGRGSVLVGTTDGTPARLDRLVDLVEGAMSSETYGLLKRPDEFFVVTKAHRNPKFVEDVVRGILAGVLEASPAVGDEGFVLASQTNYESIHKHDAIAEAFGTLGELRRELATGRTAPSKTTLAAWLGTQASAVVR